jgi:hypothetical protein
MIKKLSIMALVRKFAVMILQSMALNAVSLMSRRAASWVAKRERRKSRKMAEIENILFRRELVILLQIIFMLLSM